MPKNAKKLTILPGETIGQNHAEADDEFLFQCFYDHPALSQLENLDNSKLFLVGRTGAGKTALLRMIHKKQKNSVMIELPELCMHYVSNSDVIQFLDGVGVDLTLFFQSLWKHVLMIAFVKFKYNLENDSQKNRGIFHKIVDSITSDSRKEVCRRYINKWQGQFFITMDRNIQELTEKVENAVDSEMGGEIAKFKGRAGYSRSLSQEKRSSIIERTKKYVHTELLQELSTLIEALSNVDGSSRYSEDYFILIDKVDEKWVDDKIRFKMVLALLESLKSFRKIRNLKIIVALRTDVIDRALHSKAQSGLQREKFKDYILHLNWDETQLKKLIDKRINFLFQSKYTSDNILFSNIFPQKIGSIDTFHYMVLRTLYRPRDIIAFVNLTLEAAEGKSQIAQENIRRTEPIYSEERLDAICDEWYLNYPSLQYLFNTIRKSRREFRTKDFFESQFVEDLSTELLSHDQLDRSYDPLLKSVYAWYNSKNSNDTVDISKQCIYLLFVIGLLGVKVREDLPFKFSNQGLSGVDPHGLRKDTKTKFHQIAVQGLNLGL